MHDDVVLVIVVGAALVFDFTNGFHDTANVVATSISTRAARPQVAVAFAAILNFVGAFISISVAATVANDVVDASVITPTVVFAGLIGAIASLFANGIDPMVVIRWRDIFLRLERAIDATETAAHILEGIVIKNS